MGLCAGTLSPPEEATATALELLINPLTPGRLSLAPYGLEPIVQDASLRWRGHPPLEQGSESDGLTITDTSGGKKSETV